MDICSGIDDDGGKGEVGNGETEGGGEREGTKSFFFSKCDKYRPYIRESAAYVRETKQQTVAVCMNPI